MINIIIPGFSYGHTACIVMRFKRQLMLEDLQNKRVFVTGSSSGIGAGIAAAFAQCGARVGIHCSRREEQGLEVAARLSERASGVTFVQGDLSLDEDNQRILNHLIKTWGGIDILVNNAGTVTKKSIFETSQELWDYTMNVNLRAPFLLSKWFAQQMISDGVSGSIIHISSIHGGKSVEYFSAYAASKAALNMLTEVQALEWGPSGIRVNAIAPGVTQVERNAEQLEKQRNQWMPHIPLQRFGHTDSIAQLALFLASEAAGWTTGQVYTCDGGMSIRGNFPRRQADELE